MLPRKELHVHMLIYMCVCSCRMHWMGPAVGQRWKRARRPCGGVSQRHMGNHLRRLMGQQWRGCGVCPAGILQSRYVHTWLLMKSIHLTMIVVQEQSPTREPLLARELALSTSTTWDALEMNPVSRTAHFCSPITAFILKMLESHAWVRPLIRSTFWDV